MEYGFEIRESDYPGRHWVIIKRDEKTDGFCMTKSEMNGLKVAIQNYINNSKDPENVKE